jgi:hypothetical protein
VTFAILPATLILRKFPLYVKHDTYALTLILSKLSLINITICKLKLPKTLLRISHKETVVNISLSILQNTLSLTNAVCKVSLVIASDTLIVAVKALSMESVVEEISLIVIIVAKI